MKIAPSILSADFGNMAQAVRNLCDSGADFVHCDVMDGVYVPNITFGMPMVGAIRKESTIPFDVHLMIVNPEKYVERFCDVGADIVTFHPEVCDDVVGTINAIKAKGKMCGLAVNADKDVDIVLPYIDKVDLILIMTVQAGFGGQSFKEDCLEKVRRMRKNIDEKRLNCVVEVDGGVNSKTARLCKDAGVDIAVAGSSVFGADNMAEAIKSLRC